MADHAHHPAAPEKPNVTKPMGFALFAGMAAMLVGMVGLLRPSLDVLYVAAALAVIAIVLAVVGAIIAKGRGGTTRGFAVTVLLAAVTLVTFVIMRGQL